MLGAVLYLLVRPWLVGPTCLRYLTVGLGCGAVVGSMLLHADGVDFRVLKPSWFAMSLFIALPTVLGLTIGPAVDRTKRRAIPSGWPQLSSPSRPHCSRSALAA